MSTLDNSAEEASNMEDEEEEEDETVTNWNRAEAERIYAGTRTTLNAIYLP